MLTYMVTSDTQKVIDGLGVFEPDETRVFTEQDAAMFRLLRGVPLLQTNVPDGVEVVLVVTPSKEPDPDLDETEPVEELMGEEEN